jgi:hypothetical protein
MASLDVIRTLTIRAKTEGVDQSASSMDKLKSSTEGVANASVKLEKSTMSVDAALAKTRRTIDGAAKAQQDLAQVQKVLNASREAGRISQDEQNKLMQQAVRHFNSASQATGAHAKVMQELSTVSRGLAGNLGAVGGIMAAMGPVGLAIGVAIAAVTLGFGLAAKAALNFADELGKLADTAETIGFTVEQLKALEVAAADVGISGEQLSGIMEKFSVTLGKAREGDDATLKSLNRLQAGLADAVRSAGTAPEKFQLVLDALGKVDTATAAVSAREIFGKSGLAAIRLAGTNLNELVKNMNAIDKAAIANAKSFDAIGDSVNKNFAQAGTNIKSTFAGPVLDALDPISKIILELSRSFVMLGQTLGQGVLGSVWDSFVGGAQEALIQLSTLNIEIANLGAGAAFQNLGQRLFGPQVTAAITLVIELLKSLGESILALISLFASLNRAAVAALTFNLVGNFQEQLNNAGAAVTRLGAAYESAANAAADAAPKIANANSAAQQTGRSLIGPVENWVRYGVQVDGVIRSSEKWLDQQGKLPPKLNASTNAMGKQTKAAKENNDVMKELGQIAGQLGSSLVSAFLKGDNAAKALKGTLQSISSSAASTAINKLVTGDFAGAAVSGAISLGAAVGSFLFGDDEDEKRAEAEAQRQAEIRKQQLEQLRQAQEAFAKMADEIAAFNRAVSGLTEGTLPAAIRDILRTGQTLIDAAAAAHDDAAVASIGQAASSGVLRLMTEFFLEFPDLIAEFGSSGGPLAEARDSIDGLMDQFFSLSDSIVEFGRRTGSAEDETQRHAALQVAAIKAVLATLDGVAAPLSDIAQELASVKAKADLLDEALVKLGISAEDAAIIVDIKLNEALARLRGQFLAPLIADINRLAGADWINQAEALLTQVAQLNADATALGLQTALIQEFFVRSAQEIVDSNELVGNSFLTLQRMLGTAGGALHEFNAEVANAADTIVRSAREIADAIQANEDRLFNAIHRSDSLADQLARFDLAAQREREAEIAAGGQALASLERALAQERINIILDFQEQQRQAQNQANDDAQRAAEEAARILKEAVDFIAEQTKRIADFISDFLSGPESILKPSEQLAEAQSHFADELALAASGNRDALSNITGTASNTIDAIRRYFGSGATGQAMIQQILDQLEALPSQLTPEEFIVDNLTPPINGVGDAVIDQTDILAALLEGIRLALESGDAQAFAIALLPAFDRLDTTMDQALSFQELVTALGNDINLNTLQSIFSTLDLNGDQLLQSSELNRAATQGVGNSVQQSLTLLDYLRSIDFHVSYCDHLATILTYLIGIANWAPGSSHAAGGWITGGTPGRDSVRGMLMPGEFVVRQPVARNNPWLSEFNQTGIYPTPGNDNNSFVGAIHGLERSLLRGIAALIETQLQTAGIISKPIQEANKLTRTRRGEKKKAA